jgi:hypothetical protein
MLREISMSRSYLSACGLLGRHLTASLLLGSLLLVGCGRNDVAPPVSQQEVEDLELDFDSGLESPLEEPTDSAHLPTEAP